MIIARPTTAEYAPYYESYYAQLPTGVEVLPLLRQQPAALRQLLTGITEAEASQFPAPGKWSIKEVVVHLLDCDRVFAYRALAIARGEQQSLPAFDQDAYVAESGANDRRLADLLVEHAAQRASTVALLASLPAAAHARTGIASGRPVSVRALAWVIAAHEQHHHHLLAALLGRPAGPGR